MYSFRYLPPANLPVTLLQSTRHLAVHPSSPALLLRCLSSNHFTSSSPLPHNTISPPALFALPSDLATSAMNSGSLIARLYCRSSSSCASTSPLATRHSQRPPSVTSPTRPMSAAPRPAMSGSARAT
eukprot:3002493-Rhodomonas_salina.1